VRLAAAAVVALAAYVAIGLIVRGDGGLWVDREAFAALAPLRTPGALDVTRVLTDLGSFPASAVIVVLGAVWVGRTHGVRPALGLVVAMAVLFGLVNVGKDLWERPRPTGAYYAPGGLSYPSGHSAYVVAWLAAAALTGRRALIVAAAIVVVAVGASRLYLHVHYLTDVVGGIALGAAVFLPVLVRR
jgi:membrane-associated phospholipid phosphatase